MIYRTLFSLLLMAILPSSYASNIWPQSQCAKTPYWLEFSQAALCFDKNNVSSLKVLNASHASMALNYNGSELFLLRQTSENVTGNLHKKAKLSLIDYFNALSSGNTILDKETAFKVHELVSAEEIATYQNDTWYAISMTSKTRSFDEIFIVSKQQPSFILQIGGKFTKTQAKEIIAKLKLPQIST